MLSNTIKREKPKEIIVAITLAAVPNKTIELYEPMNGIKQR